MMDFSIIWDKYEKELTNFVSSKVYDKNYVNDIMQEIAIKIYKNINTMDKVDNVRAWLYRLSRNTIIDFFRVHNKSVPKELYTLEKFYIKEDFENNHLLRCLNALSDDLKDSDKKILDLSIHKEYSLKEISNEFDLSLEGTKSKLKRAKSKLAKKFFSCCSLEKDIKNKIIDFKPFDTKSCKC